MGTEPSVTIRTYSRARLIVGRKELEWSLPPEQTIGALIDGLEDRYGVDPAETVVMVNGRNIKQLDGMATTLDNGDLVTVTIDPVRD